VNQGAVAKYQFDTKRIEEIRNRQLREMQRRNQFQLQQMKKEEEAERGFGERWDYRERFKQIRHDNENLPHANPIFNKKTIASYIEKGFTPAPSATRLRVKLKPITAMEPSLFSESEVAKMQGANSEQPSRQVVARVHFQSAILPSPSQSVIVEDETKPYNRSDMFDTMRNISYASFFQAQAPLKQVSSKFQLDEK